MRGWSVAADRERRRGRERWYAFGAMALVAVSGGACSGHTPGKTHPARAGKPALSSPGAPVTAPTAASPLREAPDGAGGYIYSLKSLAGCQVGDALTMVSVTGTDPVRLLSVTADIVGLGTGEAAAASWTVRAVPAGSPVGEVADSFTLARLTAGEDLGPAAGARLRPAAGRLWYLLVGRLRAPAHHAGAWSLTGLRVAYVVGARRYLTTFRQDVRLPPTGACTSGSHA